GLRGHPAVAHGCPSNEEVGHVAVFDGDIDQGNLISNIQKAMGREPASTDVVTEKDSRTGLGDVNEKVGDIADLVSRPIRDDLDARQAVGLAHEFRTM